MNKKNRTATFDSTTLALWSRHLTSDPISNLHQGQGVSRSLSGIT